VIDKSPKRLIYVDTKDSYFVQCVSPKSKTSSSSNRAIAHSSMKVEGSTGSLGRAGVSVG